MLRGGEVKDIIEFKQQGLSISQISTLTGFDRKTIRKYLNEPKTPKYCPRPAKESKLDSFKPYLQKRMTQGVWNAVVLLQEIQNQGYGGKITILRDWIQPQRREANRVAVRRFETPPGQQAQVDWGEIGTIETPEGGKRLYCFVFTLGHSRAVTAQVRQEEERG